MSAWTKRADPGALGERMHELVTGLFPLARSLTGPGFGATLEALEQVAGPMERHRFASGERVFDWEIPREWTIRDAWIRGPGGETVVSFADSNLHVVSYSVPVHERMTLDELQEHLYSLPDQPDAIPYRTSYYEESWGFCLTERQRQRLGAGQYEVMIDADLEPGKLEIGEVVIEGTGAGEVLISTYCCHPSMANNELSGPVVAAHLAEALRGGSDQPRHTYRFVFGPETIGAIAYLSRFGDRLRERLVAGYVVTCVGDPGPFTYKRSRNGESLADRVAEHVLRHGGEPHEVVDFVPVGSDERQYCSPGFNLPVGSLMRSMYGTYPEYHTSLDDLGLVTPEGLAGSFQMYARIIAVLEANRVLEATLPHGEPQLGRRGLYPTTGGGGDALAKQELLDLLQLLNRCDGSADLLAVAERIDRPIWALEPLAARLVSHDLLQPRGA